MKWSVRSKVLKRHTHIDKIKGTKLKILSDLIIADHQILVKCAETVELEDVYLNAIEGFY